MFTCIAGDRTRCAADDVDEARLTFTVWDRLFGTFVDPRTVEPGYKLGLGYPKSALRMTIGV